MDARGDGTPAPALPTILSTISGPSGFLSKPPPEFTQRSSEAGILLESKTESAKAKSEINTRMEAPADSPTSSSGPQFSLAGPSGVWVPFGGGGYSLCPGRHLAKEEILLSNCGI